MFSPGAPISPAIKTCMLGLSLVVTLEWDTGSQSGVGARALRCGCPLLLKDVLKCRDQIFCLSVCLFVHLSIRPSSPPPIQSHPIPTIHPSIHPSLTLVAGVPTKTQKHRHSRHNRKVFEAVYWERLVKLHVSHTGEGGRADQELCLQVQAKYIKGYFLSLMSLCLEKN